MDNLLCAIGGFVIASLLALAMYLIVKHNERPEDDDID